ncbi:hypothetical protein [Streptomyces fulvorobeus]|uniref:Uncharacterized protein n=1 Tax=Streptomyces fulvorobeus TaxID=284028 RepID=A0A7J0CG61_9ACTN|nr:hypothetical protein [Streptomyces fulvorobeus]NYE44259.1 hypothetical protein [Streptomyces fulvorobeus]GFN00775.1 hypothetical protein Sfulv_55850 [Streptomyces fulvorobeus]
MRKIRVLAANLLPHDVVNDLVVATVVGDRTTMVDVSAYAEDGENHLLVFRPGARVTAYRPAE